MAKIYLITIEILKTEYLIDDNLDDKYLISNIQKAQDFRIEPLFEETRWTELMTQVQNNTVSDENKILITKYLRPIMAYYIMSEVIYTTAYKFKNQGLAGNGDEKANQYRFKELIEISSKYKKDSEAYEVLFREHIAESGITYDVEKVYVPKCSFYLGSNSRFTKTTGTYSECSGLNSCMCNACMNRNRNNVI